MIFGCDQTSSQERKIVNISNTRHTFNFMGTDFKIEKEKKVWQTVPTLFFLLLRSFRQGKYTFRPDVSDIFFYHSPFSLFFDISLSSQQLCKQNWKEQPTASNITLKVNAFPVVCLCIHVHRDMPWNERWRTIEMKFHSHWLMKSTLLSHEGWFCIRWVFEF